MARNHSRAVTSRRNQGTTKVNKERLVDAYNRAKAIHEAKKSIGAEFTESVTTMYELMKELGVINRFHPPILP